MMTNPFEGIYSLLNESIERAKRNEELLKQLLEGSTTQPKDIPEYLTRKEVAELFSVSTVTIDSWTRAGILTAYRIGNRIRFKYEEIQKVLKKKGRV